MAKEHTITIDGKEITVKRGTMLIEAIKSLHIYVPTLCYNENLKPYGVCRVCMVELKDGKRTRLVPSCVYEVRKDGLEVTTDTETIRRNRKWIIQLLLARCENDPTLQKLAQKYGVELNTRLIRKKDDCILCGLCVRTCQDVVGVGAISFEGRGTTREVTSPWRMESDVCIACGSCAYVCPTNCITLSDEDGVRTISRWHGEKKMIVKQSKMLICEKCGNYYMPEATADVYEKKMDIDKKNFLCPSCR